MSASSSQVHQVCRGERKARLPLREDEAHARDELVALLSHELMTPVTVLKLQAQLARRGLARDPEPAGERVAAMLDAFDRQLDRLTQLCQEMLDSAYVQAGRVAPVREEVDLAPLVHEALERATAEHPAARGRITVDVDGPLVGRWDGGLVARALTHLVKNALRFGAGKPVEVSARPTPRGARIAVRDRGIGIAHEDQERIFGRFERAVSANHFGGLGLGLFIVRAIVDAHGGTIRVESAPGEGATFVLELPASGREGSLAA